MSLSFLTDAEKALLTSNLATWLRTATKKDDAVLWPSQKAMANALLTSEDKVIVSPVVRRDGTTSMVTVLSAALAYSKTYTLVITTSRRQAEWASNDLKRVAGPSGIDTSSVTYASKEMLHGFAFPGDTPPPCIIMEPSFSEHSPCGTGDVVTPLMISSPGCRLWMLKGGPEIVADEGA